MESNLNSYYIVSASDLCYWGIFGNREQKGIVYVYISNVQQNFFTCNLMQTLT